MDLRKKISLLSFTSIALISTLVGCSERGIAKSLLCEVVLNIDDPSLATLTGSGTYKRGTEVTITCTPIEGVTFRAWVDEEENSVDSRNMSYTFQILQNMTYKATFMPRASKVNAICSINQGITEGSGDYVYGDNATLKAIPGMGRVFTHWSSEDNENYSTEQELNLKINQPKYNLEAHFEDNIITFGEFPNTVLRDQTIITELNKIETPDGDGYYAYGNERYARVDNPEYYHDEYAKDGKRLISGYRYYFKVEPIRWFVIEETDEYYQLACAQALGASHFGFKDSNIWHNVDKVYYNGNCYKYSSLREYLNSTIYNIFSDEEKSRILKTTIDCSESNRDLEVYERSISEDLSDYIYAPSYNEIKEWYRSETIFGEAIEMPDYLLHQSGGYARKDTELPAAADYWTRSPDTRNSILAHYISRYEYTVASIFTTKVCKFIYWSDCNTIHSVRACLRLSK